MEDQNVPTSMWQEDKDRARNDQEIETVNPEPSEVDMEHLHEISRRSKKGSSQLAYLVKHWEYKQANAVRLLREELDQLSKLREEVELKRREILEEHCFEEEQRLGNDRHSVSILDELYNFDKVAPKKMCDLPVESEGLEINAEYDSAIYWKQRSLILEKMLGESRQREAFLLDRLEDSIKNMEKLSTPVEELSHMLKRTDNFIHFVLQNAPIILGHMDKDLRYRFIYNHYPSFKEEDIIGKTDTEIFCGAGVKESLDFKREVLERGLPGKREITFETELSGPKTFLIYVEPVFNNAGETIGVNYIGMDVTDQVWKRERLAKLREEIAVQKAMETGLNKTMHITEETMRAKQMLATMSHEIRSPLSGVIGTAEVLATTRLDKQQREMLELMISSGDWVLQLINDILDLSKVESGVMRLEAIKFRPREVVKHVLQTAAASSRKMLTLAGHIAKDVPMEVLGDVLRIRQILTNLISNAIKFTHQGKVGIRLYIVPEPYSGERDDESGKDENNCVQQNVEAPHTDSDDPTTSIRAEDPMSTYTTVWIRCDVYDSGIGIPEHALPTLFEKYMQASVDHARKYGGTGLGLAICKQLVELMGGHMSVTSQEHCGSTFSFVLPYGVCSISDDTEGDDIAAEYFEFPPGKLNFLSTPCLDEASSPSLSKTSGGFIERSGISGHCKDERKGRVQRVGTNEGCEMAKTNGQMSNKSAQNSLGYGAEETPKILIVEDDRVNLALTTFFMRQLGHNMDVVNNGVEAVRAVQKHTYDLILMDVCMPEMDGLQATRIIRSYEESGNWDAAAEAGIEQPIMHSTMSSTRIPIIAMTANALSESAEECYLNGMDSFISKPVKFQKLKDCLQKYLG